MSLPREPKKPKFDIFQKKSVKRTSLNNEKRLSKEIGFKCTPGSGNQKWVSSKGDGNSEEFKYECKETKKRNLTIKGDDIEKIVKEAAMDDKYPAMVLSIYGLKDNIPKDWVVVPAEVWKGMIG